MSTEPTPNTIGANVLRIRKAAGLSQRALAVAAGIRRETLSDIETGKRGGKLETLRAIAESLGYRLADLLDPPPAKKIV